ncbi:MAG TPA: class I SAM-dependent methyltransferase [Blastocatellia bacterium]|nr:class I SAM-dependent methyltransferase [Blastocatellia bacterium]
MSTEKELAYRYDLFITPDWRNRFDTLIAESVDLPAEGRILEVNCGTGDYAIELGEKLKGKGEVFATDPSEERLEIARAKAQVKKVDNVEFDRVGAAELPFAGDGFDAVIGDGSMLHAAETTDLLGEMVRLAKPGGRVILKMATHGSFDEFFSVFWEALLGAGIVDQVWGRLESLINERPNISEAGELAMRKGLRDVQSYTSREEFSFDNAGEFLESPLMKDEFLGKWLGIVPEEHREKVVAEVVAIIDNERHGGPFDVSVKATVIAGTK